MQFKVKLSDIYNEMDIQCDIFISYLNKKTGKMTVVSAEEMKYAAYEDNEIPDHVPLEEDSLAVARGILGSDDYIRLPTKQEISETRIMEEFCLSLEDEELREEMHSSEGPSRRLKKDWFKYRRKAFKQIAIDWCNRNNIPYQ